MKRKMCMLCWWRSTLKVCWSCIHSRRLYLASLRSPCLVVCNYICRHVFGRCVVYWDLGDVRLILEGEKATHWWNCCSGLPVWALILGLAIGKCGRTLYWAWELCWLQDAFSFCLCAPSWYRHGAYRTRDWNTVCLCGHSLLVPFLIHDLARWLHCLWGKFPCEYSAHQGAYIVRIATFCQAVLCRYSYSKPTPIWYVLLSMLHIVTIHNRLTISSSRSIRPRYSLRIWS